MRHHGLAVVIISGFEKLASGLDPEAHDIFGARDSSLAATREEPTSTAARQS